MPISDRMVSISRVEIALVGTRMAFNSVAPDGANSGQPSPNLVRK